MDPEPTVVSTISDATNGLQGDLLAVGAVGLAIGVALFALRKGYSVVRSFIK